MLRQPNETQFQQYILQVLTRFIIPLHRIEDDAILILNVIIFYIFLS
jgi:hypothetical protein